MKDQVVMSKTNGQLAIAVPLFRQYETEPLASMENYVVSITEDKPLAYVIDLGSDSGLAIQLMNAAFVEKHLEFLGEL